MESVLNEALVKQKNINDKFLTAADFEVGRIYRTKKMGAIKTMHGPRCMVYFKAGRFTMSRRLSAMIFKSFSRRNEEALKKFLSGCYVNSTTVKLKCVEFKGDQQYRSPVFEITAEDNSDSEESDIEMGEINDEKWNLLIDQAKTEMKYDDLVRSEILTPGVQSQAEPTTATSTWTENKPGASMSCHDIIPTPIIISDDSLAAHARELRDAILSPEEEEDAQVQRDIAASVDIFSAIDDDDDVF